MITNAGLAFQAGVMSDPAANGLGIYAPACYIAVSASSAPVEVTDTALPGEITSGSLARGLAAFSYTSGANSYSLSLMVAADQQVDITKVGVFNALVGGTLVFESLLGQRASMVPGDQMLVTETVLLRPTP